MICESGCALLVRDAFADAWPLTLLFVGLWASGSVVIAVVRKVRGSVDE